MSEPTAAPVASHEATPLPLAPAPWKCKSTITTFFFRTNGTLPENVYDPLEAASEAFSDPAKAGTFRGGMGIMMLVQYHETPVGSYNEMFLLPGAFDVPPGNRPKGSRVTRIYVDQKATTYNARLSWGLPKHVVRFEITHLTNPKRLKVQAFPPDPTVTTPFFTSTSQPFSWFPSFPFTAKPLVFQPPLPSSGKAGEEEVVSTDKWARTLMRIKCKKTKLCWLSVEQPSGEGETATLASWWPRLRPWKIGLLLEQAELDVDLAEKFE